jgi:hypothetical protein
VKSHSYTCKRCVVCYVFCASPYTASETPWCLHQAACYCQRRSLHEHNRSDGRILLCPMLAQDRRVLCHSVQAQAFAIGLTGLTERSFHNSELDLSICVCMNSAEQELYASAYGPVLPNITGPKFGCHGNKPHLTPHSDHTATVHKATLLSVAMRNC